MGQLSEATAINLLTGILTEVKLSEGRMWEILRSEGDIQALAAQAHVHVREGSSPTAEQVRQWAKMLSAALETARECSRRHEACRLWTENRLRELGLTDEAIAHATRVPPKLRIPP